MKRISVVHTLMVTMQARMLGWVRGRNITLLKKLYQEPEEVLEVFRKARETISCLH